MRSLQELMLKMAGSPDKQIVEANGIPRNKWAHLDDLLCISWGSLEDQIDFSWTFTRQPRWILKQLCNADLKVYAEKVTSVIGHGIMGRNIAF
jgi:hypothetical protein